MYTTIASSASVPTIITTANIQTITINNSFNNDIRVNNSRKKQAADSKQHQHKHLQQKQNYQQQKHYYHYKRKCLSNIIPCYRFNKRTQFPVFMMSLFHVYCYELKLLLFYFFFLISATILEHLSSKAKQNRSIYLLSVL